MDITTIVVFLLVYVAMGLGHLPWLKVDRTGAAILGAMLLLIFGKITPNAAWASINFNTLGLLFGLMVVSSAFIVSGFYDWVAEKIGVLTVSSPKLLAIFIVVSGVLSALLTNDVIMVTMTPVLCTITLRRNLNPIPFLLGMCFAANIGSSGTLIGSPRNMILSEGLGLSFNEFTLITIVPTLVSLVICWAVLVYFYRNRWTLPNNNQGTPAAPTTTTPSATPIAFDRLETIKAGVITIALVIAFIFSDWPHMLVAMAAACLLLLNRKVSSKNMLKHVDGDLFLLLMGLFIINAAMTATGLPQKTVDWLFHIGIDLRSPGQVFIISAVISDLISNNPTIMLLNPFVEHAGNITALLGASISLGTGFSSNAVIFGSLAGIIVVEQAKLNGIELSLKEFMRAGVPITIITMLLAIAWIFFLQMAKLF